jgi:hypothetical protein
MTKAAGITPANIGKKIPQGATFIERYYFRDSNGDAMPYLDTATGLCQIREAPADANGSITATGTVTIDAATGEIEVCYPTSETLKLVEISNGSGYYRDIKIIYDDASEDCIVSGRILPILEVSRSGS